MTGILHNKNFIEKPMYNLFNKNTPTDFITVAPFLLEIEEELYKEVNDTTVYNKKCIKYWKIYQIYYKRNRYLFNLLKNKSMSKELYNFLAENNFLDKALLGFWKRNGYEKLCCLRCLQKEAQQDTLCICRVPRIKIKKEFQCEHCGCKGCCG
ncbi:Cell cycle control G10 family protein [Spraguea lophii 42_110]|uniref:Cell cycle control G10 family protein n=1 Tax=Spraguea lophii (strain 42_110) TaxID=1358809 RepID=S7W8D1_SPRLO|nr:Cell cycle control G10 family protein [Spraguea lophii 42_110]